MTVFTGGISEFSEIWDSVPALVASWSLIIIQYRDKRAKHDYLIADMEWVPFVVGKAKSNTLLNDFWNEAHYVILRKRNDFHWMYYM